MKKDAKVAALLRVERVRSGPDGAARARVLAKVQKTLAIVPIPLSPAHLPAAPVPVAPPPAAPLPPVPMVHPLGAWVSGLGSAGKAVVLVASLAAVGAGAVVTRGGTSPPTAPRAEPPVVTTAAPQLTRRGLAARPLEVTPAPERPPVPMSPPRAPAPPAASRASPSSEAPSTASSATGGAAAHTETLAAERALLDGVRGSLRARDPAGALAGLDRYAATFPSGALAEEAEALRVESLAAAGRGDDARSLGARFRSAHPSSLLQPAVDDALRSIP